MTKAMRKLSTVLAAVAVFNSLFAGYVFAVANDAVEVREWKVRFEEYQVPADQIPRPRAACSDS